MGRHALPGRRRSRVGGRRAAGALTIAVLLTAGAAAVTQGWADAAHMSLESLDGAPPAQSILKAAPVERSGPSKAEQRRTALARAAELKAKRQKAERLAARRAAPTTTFRVASINALGDSHTRAGGNKPGYASGPARVHGLLGLLAAHQVDVVGLQEFEIPQRATFNHLAGAWDVFTGTERGHDSIAYRTDVWEYVTGGTGTIPYFRGNPAPLPWVTLRHRDTGREVSFISVHNPTSNAQRGNNAAFRAEATRREIALVRDLAQNGNPVVLVGDFNERSEAFCMVTGGGDIGAANGGSVGGSCAPPPQAGIDWIFGTTDVDFSEYVRQQGGLVARTTDHPVVVASATVTTPLP